MSTSSLRRIITERKKISESAEEDKCYFEIIQSDNMYNMKAIVHGPTDTVYEGYDFELDIVLPMDYPVKPVGMKFITPIQHLNVNKEGDICMDILKGQWLATLNVRTVLLSLISLMASPNEDDPFNNELCELYRTDRRKYEETIKAACSKYAIKNN